LNESRVSDVIAQQRQLDVGPALLPRTAERRAASARRTGSAAPGRSPWAFGRNTGPAAMSAATHALKAATGQAAAPRTTAVASALVRAQVVRFRMLLTCCADHSAPPRAVGTRQFRRNRPERCGAAGLDFLDDRADRRGVAIGLGLHRLDSETAEPVHVGIAELRAAGLRGGEARLGPLRD
jgi:hypothetical protein